MPGHRTVPLFLLRVRPDVVHTTEGEVAQPDATDGRSADLRRGLDGGSAAGHQRGDEARVADLVGV